MDALTKEYFKNCLKISAVDAHKGTFGHALLMAGNTSRMGAAVVAARACLRAGVGLAANITLQNQSIENMLIIDVIENLGKAFENVLKQ